MNDDLISRDAVLDACSQSINILDAMSRIDDLPSVTPKQRKGHWEMCEDADGIYGVCDICGIDADFSHYGKAYPYCPSCGAKMEEQE